MHCLINEVEILALLDIFMLIPCYRFILDKYVSKSCRRIFCTLHWTCWIQIPVFFTDSLFELIYWSIYTFSFFSNNICNELGLIPPHHIYVLYERFGTFHEYIKLTIFWKKTIFQYCLFLQWHLLIVFSGKLRWNTCFILLFIIWCSFPVIVSFKINRKKWKSLI